MSSLVSRGGYSTMALESIKMPSIVETDGPAGVHSSFAKQNGNNFPASVMLAATWNKELAAKKGELVAARATLLCTDRSLSYTASKQSA